MTPTTTLDRLPNDYDSRSLRPIPNDSGLLRLWTELVVPIFAGDGIGLTIAEAGGKSWLCSRERATNTYLNRFLSQTYNVDTIRCRYQADETEL